MCGLGCRVGNIVCGVGLMVAEFVYGLECRLGSSSYRSGFKV